MAKTVANGLDLAAIEAMIAGAGASPPGAIVSFGGVVVPSGWLECDGSAVSRVTYANLFAAISTVWGIGDGSTTFNLPNFARRVPMGRGGVAVAGPANTVGSLGGAETVTLTTTEMPSHAHTDNRTHSHNISTSPQGGINSNTGVGGNSEIALGSGGSGSAISGTTSVNGPGGSVDLAGGGGAHNNVQPSAVVMVIIKT